MSRTSAAASTRCCSRAGPVRPTTSAAPTSARNRGGEAGDRADRRRRVADRVRHRPPRPRPSLLARLREAARRARLGGAGPLRRGPGAHRAVVPRERGVVGADPLGRIPRVLRAPVRQSAGLMPERLPTKLDGVVQTKPGQAKLVRCPRGRIFDVAVDLRSGSATFGQWEGYELDDEAHCQLFVPAGFGHGFVVLSDIADVTYLLSSTYDPATEAGIAWDDPDVGVEWPVDDPLLSERDKQAPSLADVTETLPF